jgi:hypothetical protein
MIEVRRLSGAPGAPRAGYLRFGTVGIQTVRPVFEGDHVG